jgi:hypothetical protein
LKTVFCWQPLDAMRPPSTGHSKSSPHFTLVLSIYLNRIAGLCRTAVITRGADFVVIYTAVNNDSVAFDGKLERKDVCVGVTRDVIRANRTSITNYI